MRADITQLKTDIAAARERHEEASKDIQRIERDMSEFSNDKGGKLAELQKSVDILKRDLSKSSASIKPLQKELQEARLESDQCGADLAAAQEQLEDVDTTLKAQQDELSSLTAEHARVKVRSLPCIAFVVAEAALRTRMTPCKRNSTMSVQN